MSRLANTNETLVQRQMEVADSEFAAVSEGRIRIRIGAFLVLFALLSPIFLTGAWALASFIRAARFARHNEKYLPSILEKTSWWILMFQKGAYGSEAEPQRKKISLHLGLSFVAIFVVLGLFFWLSPKL